MKKYGWKRELPDFRDLMFAAPPVVVPPRADITGLHKTIYQQGNLGSCTGNAIAMAFDFARIKAGEAPLSPSRLFIYYNERKIEGTIGYDAGATIRDGIKTVNKEGVCKEKSWPYVVTRFKKKPTMGCYTEAKQNRAIIYERLINSNLNSLKACLAEGFGFVFGFSVYESFESEAVTTTGRVPIPVPGENQLGGHAVFAVGYDDDINCFIVRNSWGEGWGNKGHFFLPYEYISNKGLAADFWVIKIV